MLESISDDFGWVPPTHRTGCGFSNGGGTTTISGGTFSGGPGATTQPYAVVAVSKGAVFYEFVTDAPSTPYTGPVPFNALTYKIGDDSTPYSESVTIISTGIVNISRSRGSAGGTTYTGYLTSAELRALSSAFVNANSAALPGVITDPNGPTTPILPSETLGWATSGTTQTTTVLNAGFYGDTQVKGGVVDTIRGPVEQRRTCYPRAQ